MKKIFLISLILISIIELFSAQRNKEKDYVIIKKGETLYRIAKKYNVKVDYLIKINNITNVSAIKAGSKIYIRKDLKESKKDEDLRIVLKFPVEGKIIKYFNCGDTPVELNGIDILTKKRSPVKAAEGGVVKYTGVLRGYGNIVIIEYSKEISMVYAYLGEIYVKEGENIKKGDLIARVGKDYQNRENVLHFQLLKSGKPIDPLKYLKDD
jgi:murein DD-endopeptidase MepM/ murein hydrolase activator NlpD